MAPYKNILVPYDGSEEANRALQEALGLSAGEADVDITVLYVTYAVDMDDPSYVVAARMAGMPVPDEKTRAEVRTKFLKANEERVHEQIAEFFEALPDNVSLAIEVLAGKPQLVITEYAQENGIDCIVMGRRGLGAIRATLGSVSTYVLRTSDLPVLVVR